MVAFSRITFALAVAGLSCAQPLSGPAPSILPTDFPTDFPSGAVRPTGGLGEPCNEEHGHGGHHRGFAHPTGHFHLSGPRPSGTSISDAQHARRAQQSGEAPFSSGNEFSDFTDGAAKPTGHHEHHGRKGKHSGEPCDDLAPTTTASTASGLERRQQPSGTPPAISGSFSGLPPKPTGPPPSGIAPPNGARPSGLLGGPEPCDMPPVQPTGVRPTDKPSGPAPPAIGPTPPVVGPAPPAVGPTGPCPSDLTGPSPSDRPRGSASTGFVTSTIRSM
ncbi:hypothetical protein N0V86_001796 [Didymella sp. IMI 355093]|nr:hypothetical protein N0V86_001796 [Didymella sp. IMI 355093]